MNILKRAAITPATVISGDSISLIWKDEDGIEHTHLTDTITGYHTFDEVIIFEDVIDGKNALGGAWLEEKP